MKKLPSSDPSAALPVSCSPNSVRFTAPEVFDGSISKASDVYSFGMIMYEMLTWRVPFEEVATDQVGCHRV